MRLRHDGLIKQTLLLLVATLLVPPLFAATVPATPDSVWHFVVAGDSRNMGDVIMPAIAAGADADHARFYWHLGDLRAGYNFDQDMVQEARQKGNDLEVLTYLRTAWPDVIRNQFAPFDPVPVYLAIGNHETVPPRTRSDFLVQFADWLNQPAIQKQRLIDDPADHQLKTYFHWIVGGVDFITLDNATPDMFDDAQVKWLEKVLAHDAGDAVILSVVVGMHAALPHSLACDHSMSDSPQQDESGNRVYRDLLKFRDTTHKPVTVLASHSHFVMSEVYNSEYWKANGGVLPGWIVGTSGAIRYRLPETAGLSPFARTDVYGYLLGSVDAVGNVSLDFKEITRGDIPVSVVQRYGAEFINHVFEGNKEPRPPRPVTCASNVPCRP
jgi:Calcineurin-like phosphoesterase